MTTTAAAADRPQVFRSSFWTLWRWNTTLCSLIGAVLYLISWWAGKPAPALPTAALSLGGGTVFALAVAAFPVRVSAAGLNCYDFVGRYRTLAWPDITAADPVNLQGLRYLTVTGRDGGAPLWVPLYLADMPGFLDAVRSHTGPDHLLAVAVDRHR